MQYSQIIAQVQRCQAKSSSSLRFLMVPPLPFKPMIRSRRDHSRISMSVGNRMIPPSSSIRIIWRLPRLLDRSAAWELSLTPSAPPLLPCNKIELLWLCDPSCPVVSVGDRLSPITSNSKLCHTQQQLRKLSWINKFVVYKIHWNQVIFTDGRLIFHGKRIDSGCLHGLFAQRNTVGNLFWLWTLFQLLWGILKI